MSAKTDWNHKVCKDILNLLQGHDWSGPLMGKGEKEDEMKTQNWVISFHKTGNLAEGSCLKFSFHSFD